MKTLDVLVSKDLFHVSIFSLLEQLLWYSKTFNPNLFRKRSTNCGTNPISGVSIRQCLPADNSSAVICRYTSVLPEPVIPQSKRTEPFERDSYFSFASFCSNVKGWGPSIFKIFLSLNLYSSSSKELKRNGESG